MKWDVPSGVAFALCRRIGQAGRPCLPRAYVPVSVFSPAFYAHAASHRNTMQYAKCITLTATDLLRMACTCASYTAVPARNKLPGSMVQRSLTPSATIGTKL